MTKLRSVLVLIALLAAAIGGYVIWGRIASGENSAGSSIIRPDDRQIVALGQTVYEETCASCHGVNLQGEPNWQRPTSNGLMPAPPHDETGHTWHHPDELLFKITKLGTARAANLENYVSAMPIYEGILTDDEIIAVLSYIKSTWPEEIQIGHDELNRRYTLEPSS